MLKTTDHAQDLQDLPQDLVPVQTQVLVKDRILEDQEEEGLTKEVVRTLDVALIQDAVLIQEEGIIFRKDQIQGAVVTVEISSVTDVIKWDI
jgi:hypothetical protein